MKKTGILKIGSRLCVYTAIYSILFVPVHAAPERVPVPAAKPILIAGSPVPLPMEKPDLPYDIEPAAGHTDIHVASLAPKSFNLQDLFTVTSSVKKTYPHGFNPLSGEQSKIYGDIFALQAEGKMDDADKLFARVKDNRLMGHVLAQRYLHADYTSRYEELSDWMERYADHPDADRIYKLALAKKGNASATLKKPQIGRILSQVKEPTMQYPKIYASNAARSHAQSQQVRDFEKKVHKLLRSGDTLDALKTYRDSPQRQLMDSVERDALQADIAEKLLYRQRFDSALKLSKQSADRSGKYVPKASWVVGLASWQKGDFATAAHYFNKVSDSAYTSGWLASAGSFWAARSYEKLGNKGAQLASLKKAAKHSRTFYGLMAANLLGSAYDFKWDVPKYSDSQEEILLSHAAGQRAVTLVAAGQYDLAEEELMRLRYKGDNALQHAVLAYASHVGLPGVALRLGNMVKRGAGGYYDAALYPVSPWAPEDGYRLDPALVHAVIRQESRFNLQAKSYSGALGLMQVMPKTANYIAQKRDYADSLSASRLKMPEVNMKIGQDYLEYLLQGPYVKGDVISLLVAYNAGPGNLLKWRKRMGNNDDLLLFVEMMPVKETRDYVERVLSNYWIYRLRAGLELPSLAAISNGKMPKYAHVMQDEYPYKVAAN